MENDQLTEYQREEIRIREKEIEIKNEELSLQKKWYRNPTLLAGFIMAYVTLLGTAFSAFQARDFEKRKLALEEAKVALAYVDLTMNIIRTEESTEVDKKWASSVFKHFKDAPFRIKLDIPANSRNKAVDN